MSIALVRRADPAKPIEDLKQRELCSLLGSHVCDLKAVLGQHKIKKSSKKFNKIKTLIFPIGQLENIKNILLKP